MNAQEFISKKTTEWKNNKLVKTKDISRTYKIQWVREAFTFMKQTNYPDKVFIVERLRKEKIVDGVSEKNEIGDVEYRIGYYIVGKIGRAKGKWTWGQFCPLIPVEDFDKLIQKAKDEKTIL
ncbi:MAG: hypothetical protein PHZ28_03070 [Candidatus Izemoplasmatales bacterium]|nr:hypothetical protein [Candidatus Izemoplasmatales bacterium]